MKTTLFLNSLNLAHAARELAANTKAALAEAQLTVADLEGIVEIPRERLHELLDRAAIPTSLEVRRVCLALGVGVDKIVGLPILSTSAEIEAEFQELSAKGVITPAFQGCRKSDGEVDVISAKRSVVYLYALNQALAKFPVDPAELTNVPA